MATTNSSLARTPSSSRCCLAPWRSRRTGRMKTPSTSRRRLPRAWPPLPPSSKIRWWAWCGRGWSSASHRRTGDSASRQCLRSAASWTAPTTPCSRSTSIPSSPCCSSTSSRIPRTLSRTPQPGRSCGSARWRLQQSRTTRSPSTLRRFSMPSSAVSQRQQTTCAGRSTTSQTTCAACTRRPRAPPTCSPPSSPASSRPSWTQATARTPRRATCVRTRTRRSTSC
mmetsp:Transcript_3159/g.6381  ORF Transcript_3159/g.6381 Transcript_3159/m.6381 type:complete len:225 (-) Transcript_3159:1435-2109(-)